MAIVSPEVKLFVNERRVAVEKQERVNQKFCLEHFPYEERNKVQPYRFRGRWLGWEEGDGWDPHRSKSTGSPYLGKEGRRESSVPDSTASPQTSGAPFIRGSP